jgi:hypothetical protein
MNYSRILEHAIESLKSEGRHNQADILRDVLQAYNAQVEVVEAARGVLNDIKDNWYIDKLQPGDVAESDVSVDHILALAAALAKLGG